MSINVCGDVTAPTNCLFQELSLTATCLAITPIVYGGVWRSSLSVYGRKCISREALVAFLFIGELSFHVVDRLQLAQRFVEYRASELLHPAKLILCSLLDVLLVR